MNQFVFDANPLAFRFYFLGIGSFFWVGFYALPYADLWVPNVIRLNSNLVLRYGEYRWVQEQAYYVLYLIRKNGGGRAYAVADDETRGKIEAFLLKSGLKEVQQ